MVNNGDIVRLYHSCEKYLTVDEYKGKQYVFLRGTGRSNPITATSSKALFKVGSAVDGTLIRLQHLASGSYLSVKNGELTLNDSTAADSGTVFQLSPEEGKSNVVSLKHVSTGTWLQSTNNMIDSDEEKPLMSKVAALENKVEKETFSLLPVEEREVNDYKVASEAYKKLSEYRSKIAKNELRDSELEPVINLLESLILFLAHSDGKQSQTNALDLEITESNRDRQKLLREQNVFAELFKMLALFKEVGDDKVLTLEELQDPRNVHFQTICKLCYRLLRLNVQGYRKNQFILAESIPLIQKQVGYKIFAEEAIKVLMESDNKELIQILKDKGIDK